VSVKIILLRGEELVFGRDSDRVKDGISFLKRPPEGWSELRL
jgi:hypothetical protein